MISFLLSILFIFLSVKSAKLTSLINFTFENDVQNLFVFSTTYSHMTNNAGYRVLLNNLKDSRNAILSNITENIRNILKSNSSLNENSSSLNTRLSIGELTNITSIGFHLENTSFGGEILGTITHADFSINFNGKKRTIPNIKIIIAATLNESKKNWITKKEGGNSSLSLTDLVDFFKNNKCELDSIERTDYGKSGSVDGIDNQGIYNEFANDLYPKEYVVSLLFPSILNSIDNDFVKYWKIITIGIIIAVVIVIVTILLCLSCSKKQPINNNDNKSRENSRSPSEHHSTSRSRSASSKRE